MPDPVRPGRDDDPVNGAPRKHAHPLVWLLVLAALLAFGWSFYNHRAGEATPAMNRPEATPSAPAQKPGV